MSLLVTEFSISLPRTHAITKDSQGVISVLKKSVQFLSRGGVLLLREDRIIWTTWSAFEAEEKALKLPVRFSQERAKQVELANTATVQKDTSKVHFKICKRNLK